MMLSLSRNFPVTFVIAIASTAIATIPSWVSLFELDFAAVGDGQWWRVITGQLCHFNFNHFIWDWLVFCVLGMACERAGSKYYAGSLAAMCVVISLSIYWVCPGLETYRGLSGVDTGLFAWFVIDQSARRWRMGNRQYAGLWLLGLFALAAKMSWEAWTGSTLFVDSDSFRPLVESHLAGGLVGVVAGIVVNVPRKIKIQGPGTVHFPQRKIFSR
jgi:rhomboid family GlyGly-CTERM serine protease